MPLSGRRSGVITYWALVALATVTLSACGGASGTGIRNFASGLGAPADSRTRFPGEKTDLRLDPASRAVDAGVALPNFNDGFAGKAPDLGCCELGQPLPHYGPRP